MQNVILKTFGLAALLAGLSAPAFSATLISLNVGSTGGGTWTDSSGTFSGTLIIGQVIVTDPSESYSETYNLTPTVDDFSLAFNSNTPTLTIKTGSSVEAPFTNLATNTAIETGTTSLSYTCSSCTSSTLSLSLTGSVSITGVLANFLADLGLPSTPGTLTISGGITGSSGTISSDTITLTDTANVVQTPEPSALFLLGAGLAALAAISRKKLFGAAARA